MWQFLGAWTSPHSRKEIESRLGGHFLLMLERNNGKVWIRDLGLSPGIITVMLDFNPEDTSVRQANWAKSRVAAPPSLTGPGLIVRALKALPGRENSSSAGF